jgi:hypothetical protein
MRERDFQRLLTEKKQCVLLTFALEITAVPAQMAE